MDADWLQQFVSGVSREEGHKHMLKKMVVKNYANVYVPSLGKLDGLIIVLPDNS